MFDFQNMGQWATFKEPEQIEAMERHLEAQGIMAAHELQALFSVVRANDLIWSSVVNHYLLGKEVPPSDILHWFADGAHIPKTFLLEWTKRILVANELTAPGALTMETPALVISLKDDHVSAWQATYDSAKLLGGQARFLLGGSGHNAGVINPPSANKHGYWTNDAMPDTAEQWLEGATRHEGSWWPHWQAWLTRDRAAKVKARKPKNEIEPAPGSYVRMR
jgi:polyhydroxyalkanoate synthase subunit PhaC